MAMPPYTDCAFCRPSCAGLLPVNRMPFVDNRAKATPSARLGANPPLLSLLYLKMFIKLHQSLSYLRCLLHGMHLPDCPPFILCGTFSLPAHWRSRHPSRNVGRVHTRPAPVIWLKVRGAHPTCLTRPCAVRLFIFIDMTGSEL